MATPSQERNIFPKFEERNHAKVLHAGPNSSDPEVQQVDFLWVRWFAQDKSQKKYGLHANRMSRLCFANADDPYAFGLLDPKEVIRGAHIIPAFFYGRTTEILGPSIARPLLDNDEDWQLNM